MYALDFLKMTWLVGKSIQIPKSFLVQILGEERVTKFVIQEILNTTMADYAKKASDFYHSMFADSGYRLGFHI